MHQSTFDYLKPTDRQSAQMNALRTAAKLYATTLERALPEGPDKTYALRKLREVSMWAMVSVTRAADGAPRGEVPPVSEYPPGHPAPGDLGSVPL